jgi:hypothetical protein
VDTCCIDKKSSAELSEAINSMFRWYKNAAVCYAYLSDVRITGDKRDSLPQILGFEQSKWFTRGWTLQELLAPKRVVFLDCNWDTFGTKETLVDKVSMITGIEQSYLMSNFFITLPGHVSVAEKMSWASKRITSRAEDMAYCLLGIFDINMSLLYGEGIKAFLRLQRKIIKAGNDMSVFAWDASAPQLPYFVRVFAFSPAYFSSAGDIWQLNRLTFVLKTDVYQSFARSLYSNTHKGLQVDAHLGSCSDPMLGTNGPKDFEKDDRLWVLSCGRAERHNPTELRLCAMVITLVDKDNCTWRRRGGERGKLYFLRLDAVVRGFTRLERGRIYIEI